MSSFDAEVAVLSTNISTPSDEALEAGMTAHVELAIIAGLGLPVPNPQTGQQLVIPIGKLRFAFSREQAIEVFTAALEAAQKLPEEQQPSGKLVTAQSMADVAAQAENIKRVTGG